MGTSSLGFIDNTFFYVLFVQDELTATSEANNKSVRDF